MPPVPPIPAELWDQIPPAAQAAVLAHVKQYERRLQALQQQADDLRQRVPLRVLRGSSGGQESSLAVAEERFPAWGSLNRILREAISHKGSPVAAAERVGPCVSS